ncbi:M20 family metallopeptidase [Saccharopolyspora sp. WRP15-2]|uniref:M20 family metallopeptidase n=1 Tax=Saccharopolyspora oryzae TaxID=2997343 RepID=A0ABT4V6Y8_9PSEU|nr:M20 family metallopeptidase [Saccharopolyspora oryzae]MDA3629735.1 M20 family metallopeptidase [Saccharopolyspora oryzae]
MPDPIELTQQLVRLDTRAAGEKAAAELIAPLLTAAGFEVAVDEPRPGRANLVARFGTGTPLTLTGHLDTVPADPATWTFDPHSGEIHGDRLRGRGSSDMKAGVAAIVAAAVQAARTAPDELAAQLVFTFGEETGCEGAALLPELTPSPALLVAEPTANRIVLGHKGVLWLRLTAHGRSAHGSRPELGENALAALAETAVRIHRHDDWPTSPTHGPATVNVGAFHSGVQPNLVPDRADLLLDIRTTPEFTADDARTAITELALPGTEIAAELDLPGVATSAEDPLARAIVAALRPENADQNPEYATYFTDASVLAPALGSPAVIVYGPGDPDQAHVSDETCSVTAIRETTESLTRLLTTWPSIQEPTAEQ